MGDQFFTFVSETARELRIELSDLL